MDRLLENMSILHSVQVETSGWQRYAYQIVIATVCVCVSVTENNSIEFSRLILDERPVTVMHYLYGCTSIASHKSVFAAICLKCVFPMSKRKFFFFYLFSPLYDRAKSIATEHRISLAKCG